MARSRLPEVLLFADGVFTLGASGYFLSRILDTLNMDIPQEGKIALVIGYLGFISILGAAFANHCIMVQKARR